MRKQGILGFLFLIIVIIGLFLYLRDGNQNKEIELSEAQKGGVEEIASELANKLGVTVSEDVERIALADARGEGASGLATRDYKNGKFIHSILAALPEPAEGGSYYAWLVRGSEGDGDYAILKTGKLRQSKGGYLIDYSSNSDLSDYSKVWVTVERKDDNTPEIKMLEGEF